MSYSNGAPLTSTVRGQKVEMQGLNDRLADYINKVRALKNASADPEKYREALQQLENELSRVRDAYESELQRLRRQLDEANKEKVALSTNLEQVKQQAAEYKTKADCEANANRKLQDDVSNMAVAIAQKDKEIADLRAACQKLKSELDGVKPSYSQNARNLEDTQRKLAEEQKKRKELEEKLKQLNDKFNFDSQRSNQAEKDLAERLKNANQINQALESKIKQMSSANNDDMSSKIQQLKEANMAELRKYQQETESSLNKNLAELKQQMEKESRERERLAAENATLQDCARHLQNKINELEGENQSLKQQVGQLQCALEKERSDNRNKEKELEDKAREMAVLLMNNQKEFVNARDEHANLRAEIDTYKHLLEVEDSRGKTTGYSARSAGAAPIPASPLPPSNTPGRHSVSQTGRSTSAFMGPKTEYTWAYGTTGRFGNKSLPTIETSNSYGQSVNPKTKNSTYGSQKMYSRAF